MGEALGRVPGLREHNVQRDAEGFCAVNVAIRHGIGDDGFRLDWV
jgi:hypothetical protein